MERDYRNNSLIFSVCVEALLDPGPANFIPELVNIYQQQAQHAMAETISLKRGAPELGR